jgi:hypothetical protein
MRLSLSPSPGWRGYVMRQDGRYVGDFPTVEESARNVDLSTLVEELPPPAER